ncbi:MAG: UDP-N-acetylmuramoyl-tripeptide--D-alanyl-D-alanine ligase [Hyphomicrobiaceae bacterium]
MPVAAITGFSIDTRTLQSGDVFVALKDQRDGHDFVAAALAKGAAAALVRDDYQRQGAGALIRVDDPLRALERIGVAARARLAPVARVVAITGSAGKTGTTAMLKACLAATGGGIHAPEKSYNNHWGVPLTLARMPADTHYAVFEIGMNHAGEIRPLVKMVRPHIAVITNVLPVHVGNFADGERGVARAKAEIIEGVEPHGSLLLPEDNPHSALLYAVAREHGILAFGFGEGATASVHATSFQLDPDGTTVMAAFEIEESEMTSWRLGAPGLHLAQNSVAVAGVLALLGVPLWEGLLPLREFQSAAGRGARLELPTPAGPMLLIDESYNANPASVAAALSAMATVGRDRFPRRIAVLGDMLELGPQAADFHTGLKPAVDASGANLVFCCGPNMKRLYESLPPERRGQWGPASNDIVAPVAQALQAGDVVMVKGSLGSRMAPIVAAIKKRFAPEHG